MFSGELLRCHFKLDFPFGFAAGEVIPWFFQGPRAGDVGAVWQYRLDIWRKSGLRGNPKTYAAAFELRRRIAEMIVEAGEG